MHLQQFQQFQQFQPVFVIDNLSAWALLATFSWLYVGLLLAQAQLEDVL
jgi:hypothetical protein